MTTTKETGGRSVWVTCPKGHCGTLDDHTVRDDGTVVPSLVCPDGGCDFHENVRLIGWTR